MKKGLTIASVSIIILIIVIITGTITISTYSTLENSKKITFALEISNIQEEVNAHIKLEENIDDIKGNAYTLDISGLSDNEKTQFNKEPKNSNGQITLYELNLEILGIENTQVGNKKDEKDVYVVSESTGKVYYLSGIKYKGEKYYTLTEDLLAIRDESGIISVANRITNLEVPIGAKVQGYNLETNKVTSYTFKEYDINYRVTNKEAARRDSLAIYGTR